jgi:DNA-binding CsgD family transcriptional regulator
MLWSREAESSLIRLKGVLNNYYTDTDEVNYEKYQAQTGVFSLFNHNQESLVLIFDIKNCKIVNISKNLTNFTGYNRKEFNENLTLSLVSMLAPEHNSLINVFATLLQQVLENLPSAYRFEYFLSCSGVKLRIKAGETIKCHLSAFPLESDATGKPILLLISVQDITHLMKGEDYWIRGVFGKEEKKVFLYYSGEDKIAEQEVVSEREKEVLRYIMQGLNTKQIADLLVISPNTVDNHRRNMLARTGARDTTALIHLCKMIKIV